ncbi:non-hydrolyzing UDP-N-acetylglucosamine 2-epimerase [Maricaulis sp.]|uniref:non-hydrolyzing UDP-N-acetylglucosamine 2-epimerase n=1 Tax=Maricaulis sp. TaxID=1486257 RepID=UPI001B0659EB|nr:UDP-N-acetylglucosamine 2-epimerase (non-hydrolyzing) [Maricaulis sp.]MBO6796524.1 UDP-N-acetylglucosamine 2-epimerase (non-hydrolyzing) [Maricaulis sp.]
MKTVFTVVGARPQFVKAGPVSRALDASDKLTEILVHTGQHFDANMSDVFFEDLQIRKPNRFLGVSGGGHGQMTGRMLEQLEAAMMEDKPDIVMVYGDTNSTIAGALAAAKLHIPVVHVESGLRSFNRTMPEELNRILTDHLSELLLCSTTTSVRNLANEGITKGVHHIGDVMYDATLFAKERALKVSGIMAELGLQDTSDFAVCTLHRAENTDNHERFLEMLAQIEKVAAERLVVFPVHPRTRNKLSTMEWAPENVKMIEPIGYIDLNRLLHSASLVLTDSGGLQKEAYFHETPCITLRDETEWVETVECGWNRLWTMADWTSPRSSIEEYGDGKSAEAIVRLIEENFAGA